MSQNAVMEAPRQIEHAAAQTESAVGQTKSAGERTKSAGGQMEHPAQQVEFERVVTHTPAATIEGPCCCGPIADPGKVRADVLRWASSVYETDPAKRAWIDAHVLQAPAGAAKDGAGRKVA